MFLDMKLPQNIAFNQKFNVQLNLLIMPLSLLYQYYNCKKARVVKSLHFSAMLDYHTHVTKSKGRTTAKSIFIQPNMATNRSRNYRETQAPPQEAPAMSQA
ncbi:hypothetical protein RF11_13297 [Thelohanellus kitauei]|uniref:Uncharacterized protein n=1 Tax=Thelohanellus kitauei TaxID=669202 RepID=A0A0C2N0P6_THEKT|nr:hypothetical protein RF11_13297 [Thelohanellus kitauei]